ncbi:zinc finger protein 267-like [Sycon ciliatum]|uniref:zinc finger protein 267-like n=1 Tax=Sycon ciliatum TaxID=27933 RepID=UPI0031F63651
MSPAASTPPSSTTQMSLCRRSAREILLEQLCKPSMRSLGNQYPLRCAHCGMTFIHQIHLTAHMRLHQAVPYSSVKCRECDTTCADDLSLQDHLDKAHSSGRGAFAVKFSISERIAYGHPDSPVSTDGSPRHGAISTGCLIPVSQEPLPEDFAYQSVFTQRKHKRLTFDARPSPGQSSQPAAKRPRSIHDSPLKRLTFDARPSPGQSSAQPAAKRPRSIHDSPLKQQLCRGRTISTCSSSSSSCGNSSSNCDDQFEKHVAVTRPTILEQLLTSADPTSPALPSMPQIIVNQSEKSERNCQPAQEQHQANHQQHHHHQRSFVAQQQQQKRILRHRPQKPSSLRLSQRSHHDSTSMAAGRTSSRRHGRQAAEVPETSSASECSSPVYDDDEDSAAEQSSSDCGEETAADSTGMAKDVACEHCNKRFLYKCNLARHLSAIHNERTLKTETPSLGKSPRSPFKVGRMEAIPTEKKEAVLLKCDFCARTFTQRSSLVLHQQVHQGPEPYRCSICHGVRFSTRKQMENHMARHRTRAKQRSIKQKKALQRRSIGSSSWTNDTTTSSSASTPLDSAFNSPRKGVQSAFCQASKVVPMQRALLRKLRGVDAASSSDDSDEDKLIIVDSNNED